MEKMILMIINLKHLILDKFSFNSYLSCNDIINIKTNKICFSSTSSDKQTLYIVIFHLYNEYSKMKIGLAHNNKTNIIGKVKYDKVIVNRRIIFANCFLSSCASEYRG